MRLALIVARGRNGVIGREGDLPWRLPGDLAQFKARTLAKPVIMGRKTWASLPRRPLPGRPNLVLSRDPAFRAPGAEVFASFNDALARARALAQESGAEEAVVIGGQELYREALPLADRLYLTEVDANPEGDARFPALDMAQWRELSRQAFPADAKNAYARLERVLERVAR